MALSLRTKLLLTACLDRPGWSGQVLPVVDEIESAPHVTITPHLSWVMLRACTQARRLDRALRYAAISHDPKLSLLFEEQVFPNFEAGPES